MTEAIVLQKASSIYDDFVKDIKDKKEDQEDLLEQQLPQSSRHSTHGLKSCAYNI